MKKITLAAALVLACAGCKEYRSPDGTIPAQYVSEAKALEGAYTGSFAGHQGTLTITIDGNRPTATFADAAGGTDILGGKCDSRIGQLTTVDIGGSSSNPTITGASFAFNPENCLMIQGQEITFDVSSKGGTVRLNARVLDDTRWEQGPCNYGPYGQQYCPPPTPVQTFFYGRFQK